MTPINLPPPIPARNPDGADRVDTLLQRPGLRIVAHGQGSEAPNV